MHRPPDEYNPDEWDGTDHAEEMFDPEKKLANRAGQGSMADLEAQERNNPPPVGRGYADDQDSVAAQTRQRANYKCERCGIDLKERRYLLHAHHLDGNKLNNDPSNLIALCVCCHADRDRHRHLVSELRLTADDHEYLERLRREKGIR